MKSVVRKEQIDYIYSQTGAAIIGETIIVSIAGYLVYAYQIIDNTLLFSWLGLACLAIIFRYITCLEHRNHCENHSPSYWIRRYAFSIFLPGLLWGCLFSIMILTSSTELHFYALAVGMGLAGAAILTMGVIFRIYMLFVLPMLLPLILTFAMQGDTLHLTATLTALLGLVYLSYTAYRYAEHFENTLMQKEAIKRSQLEIVQALGRAGEYRDEETGAHILRMSEACYLLALECGFSEERADLIRTAATLHDIGKIGIPDQILLKPGELTQEEFEIMKKHTQIGYQILGDSEFELIQQAHVIVHNHHEKWDGTGYPNGLKGQEIPIEARIAAVCDVFDALTSQRPYKSAWPIEQAKQYLIDHSGSHFDPEMVECFLKVLPQILQYNQRHRDGRSSHHACKVA